jgi:hypothetical protein
MLVDVKPMSNDLVYAMPWQCMLVTVVTTAEFSTLARD